MGEFNRNQFSQLLRKAQGNRSINQYAAETGISAAHISRLVRSLLPTPPEVSTIRKLADKAYHDVSYEELMEAAGHLQIKNEEAQPCYHGIALHDIVSILTVIKEKLLPVFRAAELEKRGEKSPMIKAIDSIADEQEWNSGQLIILRHIIESITVRQNDCIEIPLQSVDELLKKIQALSPDERKYLLHQMIDSYMS